MTTKLNILDYGQLVIGIGTLVLAMVLGIATWVKANRDRRVHIADKRQQWITDLRNSVSEYLAVCNIADMKIAIGDQDILERYWFLVRKIGLLLNPDESKTKKLLSKMENMKFLFGSQGTQLEFEDLSEEITEITQKILKEEWERVKNLDRKRAWW
tara:strand:- start:6947 stop:7414 length:468 start_codon:yes stop_codon:yes gene_type:complete